MFKQKRLTVLSLAVLVALVMAAVLPMSALAQDGAPPQPDVPAVEEPVVDEPVVEEPVVEEPAAGEPVVEEPTVAEVLAEVPEGTEVVVLDEAGEALPLASLEAAEAVSTSDPMWCPAAVTAVTADCVNDATVAGLLTKIKDMTQAGIIYFMPTYTENDAFFNGAALGTTANYDITFQGGWNGATAAGSDISFKDNTTFSNPFAVFSWNANVTVNNFTVTGVNTAEKIALYVGTTKDVVLNNVDVSYNVVDTDNTALYGAGATIYTAGNVTVNNSRFDGNENAGRPGELAGLWIGHHGNVTLNNVTANYNKGDGTDIWGVKNVNVSNSTFNFNTSNTTSSSGDPWGNGLWMDGIKGDVTLNNVTAIGNSYNGVEVGSKSNEGNPGNGTKSNIYVNGGFFEDNGYGANGGDGLHLSADGSIVLNDVYTYGNGDDGAELCAGGDVYIDGNFFDSNGDNGIYIRCASNIYSYQNYFWYNGFNDYGLTWWSGWHGHYYGQFDKYWGGFSHMPFPTWDGPVITLNGLYFNGNYMPNYTTYYYFYQDFYVHHLAYSPAWWWFESGGGSDWRWQWFNRYFSLAPVVTQTTPMSLSVTPLPEEDLPGDLPEGKTFADAFEGKVSGGIAGEVTEAFFEVPEGFKEGDTLTVLSWNGSAWEEVDAKIADGKVTFKVGESGTFALVTP